jgi:hypothetical protein
VEYAITPTELFLRYRDEYAPVPDHVPPRFDKLKPGQLELGGSMIPDDRVFRSDTAGVYEIPVTLRLRKHGKVEVRTILLKLALVDKAPPAKYEVKPVLARDTKDQWRTVPAYKLDDSAWKENCSQVWERIFQGATRDNQEDFLARKQQYYDTPCGHDGFGTSADWQVGGLVHDLDTLLLGEYSINTMSYRIFYEAQYEARKRWGLSPCFSVRHAIWVFREKGKDAALKYLDGLDTAGWNCVERAIRDWAREKIASWKGTGKPEGLVYTQEMRRRNLLVFDKKTHRLRLRKR